MQRTLPLAICAVLIALPGRSYGDATTTCVKASNEGQTLRDRHKLLEARDQFIACARAECPAIVLKDCAGWLDDVQKEVPTIVPSAKDGRGKDLVDVRVTMDGVSLATKLDGTAIPVNPGLHVFRFTFADGRVLENQTVVNQGKKNLPIAVAFPAPAAPPPVPPTAPTPNPLVTEPAENASTHSAGPWRPVGWMLAGVGVVGLGIGTVLGFQKLSKESDRNNICPSRRDCSDVEILQLQHLTDEARQAATLSVVGFAAGGTLLVGGLVMVLAAPSNTTSSSRTPKYAGVDFQPWIGVHGAGASIGGRW